MKKQFLRRLLSLTLSAAMLGSVSITTANASSNTNANSARWSGAGTQDSPYEIASLADLEAINNGLATNDNYAGKYFKVTQGFTIQASDNWAGIGSPVLVSASSNSPYVQSGTGFAGFLDGNSQTITVNRTVDSAGTGMTAVGGLINYLAPGGEIKDLTVSGNITIGSDAYNYADAVGGAVGYNSGVIDHVTCNVTINAATAPTATANGSGCYNVGGIAGFNDHYYVARAIGVIRNCENQGNVSGYEKVGGITGENAGLIASCSNSGTITPNSTRRSGAGGIAGRNGDNNTALETGIIWCCLNTGNIYSGQAGNEDTQSSWIGGIAGYQNSKSSIYNCYNSGNLRGYGYADYIVGFSDATGGDDRGTTRCYCKSTATGSVPNEQASVSGTGYTPNEEAITQLVQDLNTDVGSYYGEWKANGSEPSLCYTAAATNDPAAGLDTQPKKIYLNPNAGTNGDGTESSPYKDLDDAVTAANGGTVYIMDTVTLTGGDYYYSVTFDRYTGGSDLFDDPMFVVDAPNNSDGIAYVTMTSATIDGEGIGTIIQVQQGRLRLRGNIKLQNAAIGVEVNAKTLATGLAQAQVELNYAVINANVSVRLAAASTGSTNDMILASFGDTDIALNGVVSLAQGAYITVYTALTSNVTVECANPAANTEIATGNVVGGTDYTLTADDLAKFSYFGNGYTLKLDGTDNQIQLDQSKTVYLDGTAANNGDGTQASPYNSLTSALNNADANLIIVDGTTALSSGTYSGSKTIQRGANFTGTMFTAQSAMVTLSGLTISGRCVDQGAATGTILYATSGDEITLNGGVTLKDCQIAMDVAATTVVRVNQAVISAAQYSIRLDGATNELILTPASGTGITGAIFLPSNELIRVGSTLENLTGTLTVQCANASLNTAIAAGTDNYTMTAADAQRVVYQNGIYRVVLDSSANELALAEVGVAYLNGTATTNGIGTAGKPYNNLSDAANGVGSGGTVIVTGTVTITESMSLHDTVTIQRGGGFTGTMFNINAPDNSYGVAYVTFTTATIDGGGTGTVFQVAQGRLRLRGSVEVLNASTAVDLTGNGQAEINYATIKASLYAVKVGSSSNQLILDSFGTDSVSIDGEIYLDTGATITVNSAITCELDLECHTPSAGLTIATAGNDYTLTQHDADYITYINHAYGVVKKSGEDALMLANIRYLDGTASRDGTGTQARPYNNLTSALNAAGENDMIVVLGTVTVTSGTYDKAVTIQRSETLSGTMFTVSGTVTLSSMVITGRGSGTDVTQTSGSLTLNGGVTLINCDIAVDAVGGTLYYRKAVVEGRQYSLRIGAATGNCYLQLASPMSASSITGTVYLGADRMLVLPSGYNIYGITGYITLVCQDPYIGRRVVSMDGSIYGQQDMAKVRYEGGAYSLVLNGTTRIDLAAAT